MSETKKIGFVAGRPSHGAGDHEHNAGCLLFKKLLNENMDGVEVVVHQNGWPEDPNAFAGASAIAVYSDGGGGHPILPHLDQVGELMQQGVGLACLHYAVEVPREEAGQQFLDWIGGYFEMHWSVNPMWEANFESLTDHPVNRGITPFLLKDEWYFHMRFRENMDGVTPLLSAAAPESTMERPDGPHSGNPAVRDSVANGDLQHLGWAVERADGGRGLGFTGGHFHQNWENRDLRTFVLNAIAWTAGIDIPEGGIPSPTPSQDELDANLDPK